MSNNYLCTMCNKEFKRNCDLKKHQKTKCEILDKKETKNTLLNIFKNCLDILRTEGLTGEKALRNMTYILILKLIEPHFGKEIDIDEYKYEFDYDDNEFIETHKKRLLELVRFSNLCKEPEDNLPEQLKYLWKDILSKHPSTNGIFLKNENFNIKHKKTYKKLIDKFSSIDLTDTEQDVLGDVYEEVIKDIMTGKHLGQFFTPVIVKKIMIDIINPQIYPDGKIDTCCDPTMGTGGFLLTYLKYILKQAKEKNIKPDWKFIKNGLYGKEIEPNTHQLAISNLLISTGHIFELDVGDSIREPINKKFDIVMSNPPFGIDGLLYDEFSSILKNKYIPIKSDSAVSLFIQVIIYILKIKGKCVVVLPNGKDLTSKTDKTLINIRKYLLKTCDLKEIIELPTGIFTNTDVKTCIFYFEKKKEGDEVLLEIKTKKTSKKEVRDYKFVDEHQTTTIKFYNIIENKKKLIVDIPIQKIIENKYSLNYMEYLIDEKINYEDGIVIKTIDEVCNFLSKSKRKASYGEKKGLYPFYTSSQLCTKFCNEFDYKEECLIVGTGGKANIKYDSKFSCSTDNFIIKISNEQTSLKYIYHYLLNNIEILQKGFLGVGLQHISKDYIKNIKIPFPSIDKQQEIVKYCETKYTHIKYLETQIENTKKETQIYMDTIIKQ